MKQRKSKIVFIRQVSILAHEGCFSSNLRKTTECYQKSIQSGKFMIPNSSFDQATSPSWSRNLPADQSGGSGISHSNEDPMYKPPCTTSWVLDTARAHFHEQLLANISLVLGSEAGTAELMIDVPIRGRTYQRLCCVEMKIIFFACGDTDPSTTFSSRFLLGTKSNW